MFSKAVRSSLITAVLPLSVFSCGRETVVPSSRPAPALSRRARAELASLTATPAPAPASPTVVRTELVPPARPNIILITLDTVRADATPLGGSNPMPFLSKLAKEGTTFENAYTTFDSTPPAHFSMMTGFYGGWGAAPLDAKETSVPYQLAQLGYRTFGIAANGNLSLKTNIYLNAFDQYSCLYDEYTALDGAAKDATLKKADALLDHYGAAKDDFNRVMVSTPWEKVLEKFDRQVKPGKRPFFAFLNVIDAHDPYLPDPRSYNPAKEERRWNHTGFDADLRNRKGIWDPELQDPSKIADAEHRELVTETLKKTWGRVWSTTFDLNADEIAIYRNRYLYEVRALDQFLAGVFKVLADRGVLDSTVVIITADHGESLGEDHLISHSFNNMGERESTLHVPLLVVFPRSFGYTPKTVKTPVTVAAIAPTIYDIVGVDWEGITKMTLPTNIGRSLIAELGDRRPVYRVTAVVPKAPRTTPDERERTSSEAEKRLRSLGYIH
ncbi:MAG: sulfatase [Acidobacteria bacterium]|nr:sulfatase [Acidobacteriota bacterium]